MAKIYLSSTYEDLKDYRYVVLEALRKAGHQVIAMEDYVAMDKRPVDKCLEDVEAADIYVGLFAFRYGHTPPAHHHNPDGLSITELEYRRAVLLRKPCFTFLVKDTTAWSRVFDDAVTGVDRGERIKALRQHLLDENLADEFSAPGELSTLVLAAISKYIQAGQPDSQKNGRIDWPENKSPYPGLGGFDKKYAPLFFGRDREVDELLSKMREPKGRVLLVVGASGSGKSSVVEAGVWQAVIKQRRLHEGVEPVWHRCQPSDGDTPFDALARKMKSAWKLTTRPDLTNKETTLPRLLARYLTQNQELILFIDQMEELFTSGFKESDIQAFWQQLIDTAQDKENRLRVIATIRSEFIGNLEAYESTLDLLNSPYRYHLRPVSPLMLQDMLQKPAQATGYVFEPGLIDRIITDAGSEPGHLPLVAYALQQLFEKRKGNTFTVEAYSAIGEVVGAIGNKADDVLLRLSDEVRGAFDRVFAKLVHSDQESPPTRRRATMSAFASDRSAVELIDALAGKDCRVVGKRTSGQETIVEVVHEKLLDAWPFLAGWLKENAVFLAWQQGLNGKIKDYVTSNRDRDLLLRGFPLTEALEWLKKKPDSFSERERDFIHASKNHRRSRKILKNFGRIVVFQIVCMLIAWGSWFGALSGYRELDQVWLKINQVWSPIKAESPVMVKIPGGRFEQGDVEKLGEPSRKPVRPVTIKSFLMGKHEVTFGEYDRFAIAKGRPLPNDQGWGRRRRPVINVSWDDAKAYVEWLSAQTGKRYRLPTESEWEYAARGGDQQQKWAGTVKESQLGAYAVFFENSGNQTAEVGTKLPNEFGLHDLSGNVWEWVEDCAHATYTDAPEDGSAWLEDSGAKCRLRVIRGGAWTVLPWSLHASNRVTYATGLRSGHLGFRLAQDIEP